MERRVGLRGRTDFDVITREGRLWAHCRGIEVSPNGILLDRGHRILRRDKRLLIPLELRLPERFNPLSAWARHVWSFGSQQALKFVRISDVDRLSLAEHLDLLHVRGVALV